MEWDISQDEALRRQGASQEARRLIDANMNGNNLASISVISPARTAAFFRAGPSGPPMVVRGGSQRLPEAMAAVLKGDLRLGAGARAIHAHAGGVEIYLGEGRLCARHAICTVPFAALRAIPIVADVPGPLARMIAELPYTRASFAFFSAKSSFWREDGLPATIWSDDPMIGRIFVLGDDPPMLKLWTFDRGADRLDRMGPKRAEQILIAKIEAIRPAAKGKLRLERLFSWQNNTFARGIYHHIAAGQAADLSAATRLDAGRLHFAGEHLSQGAVGMEGALESAERAARAVLRAS